MKNLEKLQTLLPLGYLYLIVLGIIKETFAFYPLGINILKYATIMDILISPITDIFSHYIVLIAIILMAIISFYLPKLMIKNYRADWVNAYLGRNIKKQPPLTFEEVKAKSEWFPIRFLAVMLFSFFMGIGVMEGYTTLEKLKDGTLKYKHTLYLADNPPIQVHLIDVNNAYYFYIEKSSKKIKITPVAAVKTLELDPTKNKLAQ